jgi:hypothetical protein
MRYLVVALLAPACIPKNNGASGSTVHLQAPGGMSGDAKIELENDLQGFGLDGSSICELHLNGGPNLMPADRRISAGTWGELHLRPGHYRMSASSCAGEQVATDMDINGWTIVHFGYAEKASPPLDNAAHFRLNFAATDLHPRPLGCIADNDWSPMSNMSCCSDRTHWSREQGRLVCGP